MNRTILKTFVSMIALGASSAAWAQGQQAQSGGGAQLEEIVVQARRVDENLQVVPISVTAFTAETLAKQDFRDLVSLGRDTAGLSVVATSGPTSGSYFTFIRGMIGVASYFADVPVAQTGFSNFFDVGSVQVLKGPQGTLFGVATNGGAIVYTPNKPGETFGGRFAVTGGSLKLRNFEGAVDVPVYEDKVLFRMAAQSYYRKGFMVDISNGRDTQNQDYYILRPSLIVRPTEDIENYTLFQFSKSSGNAGIPAFVVYNPNYTGNTTFRQIMAIPGGREMIDRALAEQRALGPYKINGISATGGLGSSSWSETYLVVNTTSWDFAENMTLKNIFSFNRAKTGSFGQADTDGTRLPITDGTYIPQNFPKEGRWGNPTWTDEIQLQIQDLFDRFDVTLGTFHTATHNEPFQTFSFAAGAAAIVTAGPNGPVFSFRNPANVDRVTVQKTSAWTRAVYGQTNVDLGDLVEGLSFTGGYRYSWDARKSASYRTNIATGVIDNIQGGPRPGGEGRWGAGSYTLGLQYQMTPDTMFYFTNSKGYSSGGLQPNIPGFEVYNPESLNNLEVGVKSTFNVGDALVRLNAAAYYGFYDNIQTQTITLVQSLPPPAPPNSALVTKNGAEARIKGFEMSLNVIPVEDVSIGVDFNYSYAGFTNFPTLDPATLQTINAKDTTIIFNPEYKVVVRGDYRLPFDSAMGDISLNATYTIVGPQWNVSVRAGQVIRQTQLTAANGYGPFSADGGTVPVTQTLAWDNLDLGVTWSDVMGTSNLNAQLMWRNVMKNSYGDGEFPYFYSLGFISRPSATPRTWTLRLSYAF